MLLALFCILSMAIIIHMRCQRQPRETTQPESIPLLPPPPPQVE